MTFVHNYSASKFASFTIYLLSHARCNDLLSDVDESQTEVVCGRFSYSKNNLVCNIIYRMYDISSGNSCSSDKC